MSGVVCFAGWDEAKIKKILPWLKAQKDRYVVVLETNSLTLFKQEEYPQVEIAFFNEESKKQVFTALAWKYLFLPFSYETVNPQITLDEFMRIQSEVNFRASDFADNGVKIFKNIQANLASNFSLGEELFGQFSKVPAIICGAGPSLRKNGSFLKEFTSKAVVIAGGGATSALKKLGVTPHFETHVDPDSDHPFSPTQTATFFQLRTDEKAVLSAHGKKLLVRGNGNFELESWLEEELGLKTPSLDGGWTVGTFSLALAYHLGCDPIIFVGMDFSATQDHVYADGVKGGGAASRQAVISTSGDTVYAQLDWILAAEWVEKFVQEHPECQLINATEGGIGFKGVKEMPLKDIDLPLLQKDITKIIESLPSIDTTPIRETLATSLTRSYGIIQTILKEIQTHFPKPPLENGICALLEHDLSQEIGYQTVFLPIWDVWKTVILRHNQDGENGAFLHKILFFLNLYPQLQCLPKITLR